GNDPIWSQRAEAVCKMTEAGFVFPEYARIGSELGVRDYDALFQFRFHAQDPKPIELRLRHERAGAVGDVIVTFSDTAVHVRNELAPGATAKAELESMIPANV